MSSLLHNPCCIINDIDDVLFSPTQIKGKSKMRQLRAAYFWQEDVQSVRAWQQSAGQPGPFCRQVSLVNPARFLLAEWSAGPRLWLVERPTEVARAAARGRTTWNLTPAPPPPLTPAVKSSVTGRCKQTDAPFQLSRNGRGLHLAGFWQSFKQGLILCFRAIQTSKRLFDALRELCFLIIQRISSFSCFQTLSEFSDPLPAGRVASPRVKSVF